MLSALYSENPVGIGFHLQELSLGSLLVPVMILIVRNGFREN